MTLGPAGSLALGRTGNPGSWFAGDGIIWPPGKRAGEIPGKFELGSQEAYLGTAMVHCKQHRNRIWKGPRSCLGVKPGIRPGEVVALMGRNGHGQDHANPFHHGPEPPFAGQILVDDRAIHNLAGVPDPAGSDMGPLGCPPRGAR